MKILLFLYVTINFTNYMAQQQSWVVFSSQDIGIGETTINAIVEDKTSNIWIGTGDYGLLKYDGVNWTKYDILNSPLPVNNIYSLEVDSDNNLWIGTLGKQGGLIKFDGTNWTVWQLVSIAPEAWVFTDLEFDSLGNLWIGTYGDALVKFDGEDFTQFNTQTTDLDSDIEQINAIKIKNDSLIWCVTDLEGAMTFDGESEWKYYRDNVYDNSIYSIDIDFENNVWFGGVQSISQYDGESEWTQYDYTDNGSWYTDIIVDSNKTLWFASWTKGFLNLNYSNGEEWMKYYPEAFSVLENEGCWSVYKDSRKNYWIGYNNGYIAVYNPDGVNGITDVNLKDKNHPYEFVLYQNYPNPFNPSTVINYSLPSDSKVKLQVFNTLGEVIATLVDEINSAGVNTIEWNASNLASGVYLYRISAESISDSKRFNSVKKMLLIK